VNKRQEMVIGVFTKNEVTSKAFSSLLVGVFEKKKILYTKVKSAQVSVIKCKKICSGNLNHLS